MKVVVDYIEIGKRIKNIRTQRKLSISNFSTKLGINKEMVEKIEEYGKKVSASLLIDICNLLDVNFDSLLKYEIINVLKWEFEYYRIKC